jgi:hypothetical protein
MPPRKSKLPPAEVPEDEPKEKKIRAKPIEWEKNKMWTTLAIEYLDQNPKQRIKLFSDSTSDAKNEGRTKVQNGEAKLKLYGAMAEAIFTSTKEEIPQATREEYLVDPHRFAKSTQQQFSRSVNL